MTDRRSPTVVALRAADTSFAESATRLPRIPGAPSGMTFHRIGRRRFQMRLSTGPVTPPRIITVVVKRHRVRFVDGIDATTPDRVRAAAETGAQLLWERYGVPVLEDLPVTSPVRAVCRRTEADGTVVHRVRVASAALAGHHVAEIRADGAITYPPGRRVPAAVIVAVEEVAALLHSRHEAPTPPTRLAA